MKVYKKTVEKYGFKRKNDHYKSTIYFNSKSVKIMVYDKEIEREKKNEKIEKYEKEILRFEICLQNRHLNYMKNKKLENYFTKEFWSKYMIKNICPLFFQGDYYPIFISEKIIMNSHIKECEKLKLRGFLCDVSKYGLDGINKLTREIREKINMFVC